MRNTSLTVDELNKRCEEVFELQVDDFIYDVSVDDKGTVYVNMSEVDEDGNTNIFDYLPDMTERPEALEYLLGERDDFTD